MPSSGLQVARYALVGVLAMTPTVPLAQACGREPPVSGAASFQAYRNWCACMGGSVAGNFNDAQRQGGCRLPGGAASTSGAGSGAIGTSLGAAVGAELGKSLFGDPDADARRRAAAAVRSEELRGEADSGREEQRSRLLESMIDVDRSVQPGLDRVGPSPGPALMSDEPSSITPPARPLAGRADAGLARSPAYSRGFEHASGCFSENAGPSCVGATGGQQQACLVAYRAGYDAGSVQRDLVLREARQAGRDAGARGELANAASDPRALGPCRVTWIEAYNEAHFRARQGPINR
jgi:hypothetical protein